MREWLADLPPPLPHDTGHMLRFFMALSFVCSALFGFFYWTIDRTDRPTWMLVVNATAVITAMVACLGHLLAWRRCTRSTPTSEGLRRMMTVALFGASLVCSLGADGWCADRLAGSPDE